jgi:hypothetical protein
MKEYRVQSTDDRVQMKGERGKRKEKGRTGKGQNSRSVIGLAFIAKLSTRLWKI